MEYVRCLNKQFYFYEKAYNIDDYPYNEIEFETTKHYIDNPITFDIETTTITSGEVPEAFMYIWQVCIQGKVIFGRTWNDFIKLLDKLKEVYQLEELNKKLVIYVHNLSFEFMFIKDYIHFDNVFATDRHKVLKCSSDYFEFRCSYYLSNMNLKKFIENSPNGLHYKGVDDLDYTTIRTPKTQLNLTELGYCFNDVMGLYEAINDMLINDNLETIPLTSTGYVRRDCRKAMRRNKKNRKMFLNSQLTPKQFILLKECFRGGNTASSRYLCNQILKEVGSYDISSSYPYVMVAEDFPIGRFQYRTINKLSELIEINKSYCTIARYVFVNLKLKTGVPIPYISSSKCNAINNEVCFNGRVLTADLVELSLTNIDLDIVLNQYDYDDMFIKDFYYARKGKLPTELIDVIFDYFEKKSTLKGIESEYYEYMRSKGKLNSIYGMTVTNPIHPEVNIDEDGEWSITQPDVDEGLYKFYKSRNNFLPYQWGVFVTAYARKRLQEAIDLVGLDTVYCDTDSVKYIGNHDIDFEILNTEMINKNHDNGIKHSIMHNNKVFMLGQFDSENIKGKEYAYDEFITLGAKKYAYRQGTHLSVTVAGLSKKKGAEELERGNGLLDFKNGKVFNDSGRTVAYFNNAKPHNIVIDDVTINTASNIAIVPTTYTLGISDTMLDIITEELNARIN